MEGFRRRRGRRDVCLFEGFDAVFGDVISRQTDGFDPFAGKNDVGVGVKLGAEVAELHRSEGEAALSPAALGFYNGFTHTLIINDTLV